MMNFYGNYGTSYRTKCGYKNHFRSLSQTVGCGDPDNYSDLTHEADTMQAVQGIKVFVIHSCFDCILKKKTHLAKFWHLLSNN